MRTLTRLLLALVLLALPRLVSAQGTTAQVGAISSAATLQSAAVANGNGTAFTVDGYAIVGLTVNCATCSGGTTVNFELSEDGTNFTAASATLAGSTTIATSTTTAGVTIWTLRTAGFKSARARISSYSAGTITVTGHAVPLDGGQTVVAVGNTPTVTANAGSGTFTVSGTVTTTPPSNASSNVAQVAGTTTDTNSGVKSAGTLRVVLATDQPALTNKLLVTPDSVALPANQSVNESQINGVTPLMGNGVSGTGAQRVTLASDSTGQVTLASGAVVQANAGTNLNTSALALETGGNLAAIKTDVDKIPSQGQALAAASLPVVLTAAQITTLTPPTTVTANAGTGTLAVSAASLPLPALAATSTKQSDGTQKTQIVDGSGAVIASTSNNLNVQCANCSGSGASAVDAASFTAGSSVFAPDGGEYNPTATPLASGTQGMGALTAYRSREVTLYDASGNQQGTATNPVYTSTRGNVPVTIAPGGALSLRAGGLNVPIGADGDRLKVSVLNTNPCSGVPYDVAVSQTASTRYIAGIAGQRTIICAVRLVVAAAEITSELEGTGAACATNTVAHSGSTTAANGESFAANGGYSTTIPFALKPGQDFCIGQSGANRVSGKISFVYAP